MNRPAFLDHDPVSLAFGTSGLRALVSRAHRSAGRTSASKARSRTCCTRGDIGSRAAASSSAATSGLDTPRIMRAAMQAIVDSGLGVENAGQVPTPALVLRGLATRRAGVMVTGSHIPFDRNGIKITKSAARC